MMRPFDSRPAHLMEELRLAIHDMDNAITPVLANAQLARPMAGASERELDAILKDIVEASTRAKATAVRVREIAGRLREAMPETSVSQAGSETTHG